MKSESTENIVEQAKALFTHYLERHGCRKTAERFAVLDEVYALDGHFDVDSLYLQMKGKHYRISRATLYNTIELLLCCKLVIRHNFGNKVAQYEKALPVTEHDHIICMESGEILEFSDLRIQPIIDEVCAQRGFKPVQHTLYIYAEPLRKS